MLMETFIQRLQDILIMISSELKGAIFATIRHFMINVEYNQASDRTGVSMLI